jgi:hypothetical protein
MWSRGGGPGLGSWHESAASENQLPGALEEDELPAVVLAGAAGTFAIGPWALQVSDELDLVAETGRAVFGRRRCLLQGFHLAPFCHRGGRFSRPNKKE